LWGAFEGTLRDANPAVLRRRVRRRKIGLLTMPATSDPMAFIVSLRDCRFVTW
jgi:hypothetical protein